MMLAALAKAESLAKFARASGSPLDTFQLTLTEAEAFELLDYLAAGGMGWYQDHHKLVIDVALAKANHDPWSVLENFELEGLTIGSVDSLS
jgi:hypothetical protein